MSKQSWVQINGKLVPKSEARLYDDQGQRLQIIGDIEPFQSPITGELIRGRGHLRRHMKEHGVTHFSDYSPEWFEKKQKENRARMLGQDKQSRLERIELLKQQLER